MKYFIYFHFYAMSLGDDTQIFNASTVMWSKNDSLTFYVYNFGYTRWKIDEIVKESIEQFKDHSYTIYATYLISFEGIKATVNIRRKDTEIRILTGNLPYIIQLK